jgi:hypothetical protein
MSDIVLLLLVFSSLVFGIWLSYRLFMRGDTNPERIASRLPKDFKPDWTFSKGDTYAGYENASRRLALVDYPKGAVVPVSDVVSIEPMDESVLGLVHRWIVVTVGREGTTYNLWFQFSGSKRDEMLARLKGLGK